MGTALVVIDLQEAMRDTCDAGNPWANPGAVEAALRVLAGFRAAGLAVVHGHHHDTDPADEFHPDNPLSAPMPEMVPLPGEAVVVKHGLSGLISTGLKTLLREAGRDRLVVPGGEASMCVESTVRMAGNLGFKTTVVADALINFGRRARDGREVSPEVVLDMSLSNLRSFARIVESGEVSAA